MPPTDPAPPSYDDVPTTGATPSIADQVSGAANRAVTKAVVAVALALLVPGLVGAVAFYTSVKADSARTEEVNRVMQRDIASVAGDVDAHGHSDLGEDVATLRTKIDRMQEDVDRIRRLLDERLPPRPPPRRRR